jgi:protein tyrosine phosphatase (PTP) superfamily phosphohydrolase (DUF442 family)
MNEPVYSQMTFEEETSLSAHTVNLKQPASAYLRAVYACASVLICYFIIPPLLKILLFGFYSLNHNLHEVVPGELYRSSSMASQDLVSVIEQYKIRTVFDLRTHDSTKDKKGKLESLTVLTAGAKYLHFRMETLKKLTPEQIITLIGLYQSAERPVLIHCSSGSERTSVAVAIWLLSQTSAGIEEAASQLALSYGYLKPWLMYKQWRYGVPTINRTVDEYFESTESHTLTYREWVQKQQVTATVVADTQRSSESNIH